MVFEKYVYNSFRTPWTNYTFCCFSYTPQKYWKNFGITHECLGNPAQVVQMSLQFVSMFYQIVSNFWKLINKHPNSSKQHPKSNETTEITSNKMPQPFLNHRRSSQNIKTSSQIIWHHLKPSQKTFIQHFKHIQKSSDTITTKTFPNHKNISHIIKINKNQMNPNQESFENI